MDLPTGFVAVVIIAGIVAGGWHAWRVRTLRQAASTDEDAIARHRRLGRKATPVAMLGVVYAVARTWPR